jgi:hypothetical protein|tara:strand:+ start:81 stop:239 length:159 start_codon:yes stop_codon:yes gene_type:complete
MDTEKWKSILVPRDTYEEIKKVAKAEGRTISGQLRLTWQQWKDGNRGQQLDS